MAGTKNQNLMKYVLSLDSLDMALLPIDYTSRFNNKTTSLWSTNLNFNADEYFEFEVKRKDESCTVTDNDSTSNYDDIANDTRQYESNQSTASKSITTEHRQNTIYNTDKQNTICHICDIEVPRAYVTDHETSLKHKAYVKIAEVVLDRTRKHMLNKAPGFVQKNDSMYFCGACACEVEVVNKDIHDKSKVHKQSVSLDRLLYELVALYSDEDGENAGEGSLMTDKFNDNANGLKIDANSAPHENNTIVISDVRARLDEFEVKTMQNYIRMIDEYDMDKPYSLSSAGDDIRIAMEDGCQVTVAFDNFNGFVRIEDNFIMCIVCKVIAGNENAHKISDLHLKNIITPLKDRHCIRNLDNSLSHCVICNKVIENADLHILCDKNHVEKLKTAVVVRKETLENLLENLVVNPNEVHQPELVGKSNKSIEHNRTESAVEKELADDSNYHNSCMKTNGNRLLNSITLQERKLNGSANNSNKPTVGIDNDLYHCQTCNITMHVNSISTHMIGKKHVFNSKSKLHYIMKQDIGSNYLICRVCDTQVADDKKAVKMHVRLAEHILKYDDLLASNHMIRLNGNFYCTPCNITIPNMNEFYHMERLSHELMLTSYSKIAAKVNTVNQSVTEPTSSELQTKNPNYYCDVCSVYIPNNPHNIGDHNDGLRHKKNVAKTIVETADSLDSDNSIDFDSSGRYQMDPLNEKNLMCKVCKVPIPNIDENIIEHITGKKHQLTLKILTDANHIECTGERIYCKECKLYIKTYNLFKHMDEKRHKELLGNLEEKPAIVKETEPKLSPDPQANIASAPIDIPTVSRALDNEKHLKSINESYLKFKHHFMILEGQDWLLCKICFDTSIPNTAESVAEHTGRETHLNGYKNLMSDNLIFETAEREFFCAVCDCLVPFKGEVHHAKGLRHGKNYIDLSTEQHCNVCDLDMSGMAMSDHIRSQGHLVTKMKSQSLVHYCEYCKVLVQKDKAETHAEICHKFAVKDKICFCSDCHPPLPSVTK